MKLLAAFGAAVLLGGAAWGLRQLVESLTARPGDAD